MQFRLPASITIFLGSYLPLALILLVQDFNYASTAQYHCWIIERLPFQHPYYSLGITAICAICFCFSLLALEFVHPKVTIEITDARYIPAELMTYTLPYVVSFMSVGYQDTGKLVGLIIFLFWIFLITHSSGQVILNPLLIVFGWRLYEIKYAFPGNAGSFNGRALAKGFVEAGQRYQHKIVQDIIILRQADAPGQR